jgi:hypothetical protein
MHIVAVLEALLKDLQANQGLQERNVFQSLLHEQLLKECAGCTRGLAVAATSLIQLQPGWPG